MKTVLKENTGEALVGLLVVVVAVWFVLFAWSKTGKSAASAGGITVTAMFPSAGGVNVGTDVKVAGVKVGSVTDVQLDPKTYQVAVKLALRPTITLPADSSASIATEGLLGGTYVGMTPGGADAKLKGGDTITDTQGSMDLMALIGQFINKPSGDASTATRPADADAKP